jgi:NADPH:quinone reductase-like Zn-dependent oxidoreductase
MNGTYRAVEVSTPGVLRMVERPISKPAVGQVRLRVKAWAFVLGEGLRIRREADTKKS